MNNPLEKTKVEEKKEISEQPAPVKVAPSNVTDKALPKVEPPVNPTPVDAGINLIPTMTTEEVVVEEKKKKLNVGSIVSLLILVVISILIVGFNIISKLEVNNEKKVLGTYETSLQKSIQKMTSSDEITDRVLLYKDIEGKTYSPKKVVEYLKTVAAKSGSANITKFTLGNDLSFTIEGTASDLENVSKLWYLLSNDPEVSDVTLKSVNNGANSAAFSFEGNMVFNYFLSSSN